MLFEELMLHVHVRVPNQNLQFYLAYKTHTTPSLAITRLSNWSSNPRCVTVKSIIDTLAQTSGE